MTQSPSKEFITLSRKEQVVIGLLSHFSKLRQMVRAQMNILGEPLTKSVTEKLLQSENELREEVNEGGD